MTPALHTLLQDAVPEPPRLLDPDTVLHRARRRRLSRTVALLAAAVLVLGAAGAALVPGPWRHRAVVDPAAVPLTVSALAGRQPVPPGVADVLAPERPAHPGEAALVGTIGPDKVWLADTADDALCLVVAREEYGRAGYGCQPRRELLRAGLVMAHWPEDPSGPVRVVVVAPDGYATASADGVRAAFRENIAILAFDHRPAPSSGLTISGPDLPDVAFPLEPVVGPGPAPAGTDPHIRAARQALTDIAASARRYAQDHSGSTRGFAASLPPDFVSVLKRQKIQVTDTGAATTVRGHCLSVVLATGQVTDRAC